MHVRMPRRQWIVRGSVLILAAALAPTLLSSPSAALSTPGHAHIDCSTSRTLCTEVQDSESVFGQNVYVGHDEPALTFYDNRAGSGNNATYQLQLPKDPPVLPRQGGTGGTFNFELHPTFWVGMAMCDNQSAPEFTHAACTPDSDSNIFDSPDPADPTYLGRHPGTAFMEMQFYPPGWVSWPPGVSCDAKKWCGALTIDSLSENQNTGQLNNADCLNQAGIEPVNFAFITRNGHSQAPADPLRSTVATFTPDRDQDLFMNSGDRLAVSLHDTAAGFQVNIVDLSTGQTGSMTASVANGFGQVVFDPSATTCTSQPYAFHPMYSTSSEHTRVVWAAHSYNVAFSDEIGHFELCNAVDTTVGSCTQAGANDKSGLDSDDVGCFSADQSLRVQVSGCLGGDADFDGASYLKDWPGTTTPSQDALLHPTAVQFTSPVFNGFQHYQRNGFEADLPRIEAADSIDPRFAPCNRTTGANCVNPPPGAQFYPIYTTRGGPGGCQWQLGGANIPGTRNTFGGTSTAEYGPLLLLTYPGPGFAPTQRFNNFRQILARNPC
jgi:hypothetical protein